MEREQTGPHIALHEAAWSVELAASSLMESYSKADTDQPHTIVKTTNDLQALEQRVAEMNTMLKRVKAFTGDMQRIVEDSPALDFARKEEEQS